MLNPIGKTKGKEHLPQGKRPQTSCEYKHTSYQSPFLKARETHIRTKNPPNCRDTCTHICASHPPHTHI
eukprot:c306_g1_i1 orf=2-205(-)